MAVNSRLTSSPTPSSQPQTLAEKIGGSHVGIRNDLEVSRHVFFGETSYVVRDPISFEGHNFSSTDYEILISLNDQRCLSEIFAELKTRGLVNDNQAEEFYRFVIELQVRGLLSLPITDGEALYQQYEQKKRRQSANPLMRLMFLKVPLGCPDHFLRATYRHFKPLFSRSFFVVWLIGLLTAIYLVVGRWDEFTSDLTSMLAVQNLPAILLITSLLKLWHELGHGYACRHYGVSVPNAGLLFMIGTPLAFVDATGSWSLPRRSQRQVINLAGVYFEMMIAIAAALVWAATDNASIQSLAHFTLLISSVTTIGFNFNPLMKYDGYYVLADALGIPNLRGRAAIATSSMWKRLFLGLPVPSSESRTMRMILISYGICATIYKWMLVIAISTMLAMQIWIVGILIGGYYFLSSLLTTLWSAVKYLAWSEEVKPRRVLAWTYLGLLAIGIPMLLMCCPVPGSSHARGVVENETISVVHVEESGFLKQAIVPVGQRVNAGQTIGELENLANLAQTQRLDAELAKLEMKYRSQQLDDRVKANQTLQEIRRLQFEIDLQPVSRTIQTVSAPTSGQIIFSAHKKGSGEFLTEGAELLRIGSDGWVVRGVANARSLADVKPTVGQKVHCRFHSDPSRSHTATIESVSRAGSRVVRHAALTQLAGGFIPVNPDTMEATEPFFELTIKLNEDPPQFLRNGAVCEIRFDREYESLGRMSYRSLLRLLNKIELK